MASQGIRPASAAGWNGGVPGAVYFDGEGAGEKDLLLWGTAPQLGEVIPQAEALAPEDRQDLCLLAALWETGKIGKFKLEFT